MLPDALASLLPTTPVDVFLQKVLTGQPVVWESHLSVAEVVTALCAHRLGPLLCAQLLPETWGSLPGELQTWLKASARAQVVLDFQQILALQEVLPLAEAQGIRVLLLKGVPVGYRYYTEPHHRVKTDVDLLVCPADVPNFVALLEKLGYTPSLGITGKLVNRQMTLVRGDVAFDVHWSVANTALFAHALVFEPMWRDRVPIPELGAAAYSPADEDLFLHACFHLALHMSYEFALVWLYDVHLMSACWSLAALEQCLFRARQLQIAHVCLACLALSRVWFGTPYDDDFCAELARESSSELSAQVLVRRLSRRQRLWLELQALSWGDRMLFLWEMALPSADYLRRRYGDTTTWLPWLHLKRWLGQPGRSGATPSDIEDRR
ncbi:MAG: nucleotidyltransferase domain-containing protein [Acidobacteriota bacterium]